MLINAGLSKLKPSGWWGNDLLVASQQYPSQSHKWHWSLHISVLSSARQALDPLKTQYPAAGGASSNTRTGVAQLWRLQKCLARLNCPCHSMPPAQRKGTEVSPSLGQAHLLQVCCCQEMGVQQQCWSSGGAPITPVLRNNKARILRQQILNLDAWVPPRRALDLHSVVIWEWKRFILPFPEPDCANRKQNRHF